ncbi:MAG: hypothetical protein NT062_18775 [Proteobacteria bacterium]|nr:hypothetical protein [Pseudomonadota bacterium]
MTSAKTIGVDLWAGQVRGNAPNAPTMMGRVVPRLRKLEVVQLFEAAYPRIVDRCREVDEPGVAIVAVDERTAQVGGLVRLRARVDRHVAAIVGRHDACDLYLANDSLALRHLAILVDPVQSWAKASEARFRIFDLRTAEGMRDEEDRPLRGLRAEGPAVVRAGGYVIFALPLGDPTDWPASARDAWDCLPQRVYFDELECIPDGTDVRLSKVHAAVPAPISAPSASRNSAVIRTHGPWDSSVDLPIAADEAAGTLSVVGPHGRGRLHIGRSALVDGVLLGRYARCDGAGLGGDGSLSRVHVLLLLVDDRLIAVDTASTYGSRLSGGANARVLQLTSETELELGLKTQIRWRWR